MDSNYTLLFGRRLLPGSSKPAIDLIPDQFAVDVLRQLEQPSYHFPPLQLEGLKRFLQEDHQQSLRFLQLHTEQHHVIVWRNLPKNNPVPLYAMFEAVIDPDDGTPGITVNSDLRSKHIRDFLETPGRNFRQRATERLSDFLRFCMFAGEWQRIHDDNSSIIVLLLNDNQERGLK